MYQRIVIKIGTKVLTTPDGLLDELVLRALVRDMCAITRKGTEIILVTSGAVGSGRALIQLAKNETVADKQVYAAVGQIRLMATYARLFEEEKMTCAQVLVTKEDFRDRNHYENMQHCFRNLLRDGIIPVVNENDVIAIKELVFTDNDELAGLIAAQMRADAVIILTSVDGVLDRSPSDPAAKTIPEIDLAGISAAERHVTTEKTDLGRGGMLTKFAVAKKLMRSGIALHIMYGKQESALTDVIAGKTVGTRFVPARRTNLVKRRLAYAEGLALGAVTLNTCASDLLRTRERVMSILPIGVVKVIGAFEKGDVIEIRDHHHVHLGYGIAACTSQAAAASAGKKGGRPVIHYDYLFIE